MEFAGLFILVAADADSSFYGEGARAMLEDVTGWLSLSQFVKGHEGAIYRNTAYRLIKEGVLLHVKRGKIFIPADALERLI